MCCAHLVFRQLLQRREIDLLDQPAVQAHLGVEQLVGVQRVGGLRAGSAWRLRHGQERHGRTTASAGASAAAGSTTGMTAAPMPRPAPVRKRSVVR